MDNHAIQQLILQIHTYDKPYIGARQTTRNTNIQKDKKIKDISKSHSPQEKGTD